MRAIAGLGNPGSGYSRTRHNAGQMLLAALRERGRVLERRDKESAHFEKLKLGATSLWLIWSTTYMNASGTGVAQACRSLQIEPRDLLVAYDDVDLPLGQLRLRRGGGAGGHRGLESVIAVVGTQQIPRLRLGVRGAETWHDTADYVLADFTDDEQPLRDDMIERGVAAVQMICRRGFGAAMNTYNRRKPTESATPPEPEEHPE